MSSIKNDSPANSSASASISDPSVSPLDFYTALSSLSWNSDQFDEKAAQIFAQARAATWDDPIVSSTHEEVTAPDMPTYALMTATLLLIGRSTTYIPQFLSRAWSSYQMQQMQPKSGSQKQTQHAQQHHSVGNLITLNQLAAKKSALHPALHALHACGYLHIDTETKECRRSLNAIRQHTRQHAWVLALSENIRAMAAWADQDGDACLLAAAAAIQRWSHLAAHWDTQATLNGHTKEMHLGEDKDLYVLCLGLWGQAHWLRAEGILLQNIEDTDAQSIASDDLRRALLLGQKSGARIVEANALYGLALLESQKENSTMIDAAMWAEQAADRAALTGDVLGAAHARRLSAECWLSAVERTDHAGTTATTAKQRTQYAEKAAAQAGGGAMRYEHLDLLDDASSTFLLQGEAYLQLDDPARARLAWMQAERCASTAKNDAQVAQAQIGVAVASYALGECMDAQRAAEVALHIASQNIEVMHGIIDAARGILAKCYEVNAAYQDENC